MSKHVIEDAKRCLQCKNPTCSMGCPMHTPIRDAIRLLLESKISQAGELLFENNPLSLVCCHVCPQENQCEGHCILGKKGSRVCQYGGGSAKGLAQGGRCNGSLYPRQASKCA